MVVIDYLQLLDGDDRQQSREREVANMSRAAKQLAKELDIPVIILAQLSRKVEERPDKTPLLSDLRESGAIEQDADMVLFIMRPEYYGIQTIETAVTVLSPRTVSGGSSSPNSGTVAPGRFAFGSTGVLRTSPTTTARRSRRM